MVISKTSDWIFTRTVLLIMLKGRDSLVLHKVFPFVVALTNRSAGHERTAAVTSVCARSSPTVSGVKGYKGKRIWDEKELDSLKRKLKYFARMSIKCLANIKTLFYTP